jgi:UDP-N-acetylglucosamine--N-acetylmuramyl-(pentapeptide) pyrophosphoryl-undecaprenol N-acetylglucosamine transferase
MVIVAMMQAFNILRSFRPDVVVGTGGYVSGPMLYAATLKKVPTLIQEQNSFPGETTRFLAKRVSEVHITFEESRPRLPRRDHVFLSGNPTRAALDQADQAEALAYFGFPAHAAGKVLLVFGGSLGAATINHAVERHIDALVGAGLRVIWQTGTPDAEAAAKFRLRYGDDRLWTGAFIDRMDLAYAASTMVLCRAGATTIAELTRLGKPAILVPYPYAAADHQTANARSLVEAGAAAMLDDRLVGDRLADTVLALLHGDLGAMASRCRALGRPDAARVLAEHVAALAERNG